MQNVCSDNAWVDRGGRVIDSERVSRHERLLHGMIKKFLPKFALFEASMSHKDLANAGRLQIALALQKFDPAAALAITTKDESRKRRSDDEHMRWKRENPEAALEVLEGKWVTRRLVNWLRRIRHEYSPKVRGGKSVSITAMLAKANSTVDENGAENQLFGPKNETGLSSTCEDALSAGVEDLRQTRRDVEGMLDLLLRRRRGIAKEVAESEAVSSIAEAFRKLSAERQADVVEYLRHRSDAGAFFSDDSGESEAS